MLARWLEDALPEAAALIAEGRTISYAGLRARADGLASWLVEQGLMPGATLAVLSASPLRMAMLAWSVARLGGTLLPLNPCLSAARLAALLEQAGADWIVADDDLEAPFSDGKVNNSLSRAVAHPSPAGGRGAGGEGKSISQDRGAISAQQAQKAWNACTQPSIQVFDGDGNPIELMIATSGSEGEPKCVMLSGGNLAAAVLAARSRMPLRPGEVWLNCLPLYHVGGMSILYRCAQAGATMLLHERFESARVMQALQAQGVTHVSLVPAMLAQLIEAGPPPSSLKYVLTGGGPLSASLAQRAVQAGWPLCPSYGLSEAASQVATLCPMPPHWREGMAGLPLPGMEVEITGGQSDSQPGRIRLRGPMVMAGYANPAREGGHGLSDGWLVTGDRGYLDADGNLVVLGRDDDMLISGGVNVHPAEVETLLLACPGVTDAAMTALADDIWGQRLAALVVGSVAEEAVRDWCRANMPGYMRPRLIVLVPDLPRNALGKLERGRLPELVRATIKGGVRSEE